MSPTVDRLNHSTSRWSPRQLARRALVACLPKSRFVDRLPGTAAIYLTFDDGPHPVHTPAVLDVLRDFEAKATFFVVGRECERHPEILRRIVADGHAVGNHTYSHPDARQVSLRNYLRDVDRSGEAIERIIGVAPRLFRPPYGRLSVSATGALALSDVTVVLWNVDTRDYAATTSSEVGSWIEMHPFVDGDVVLMHDSLPHAANVLGDVLRNVGERKLAFRAVGVNRSRENGKRRTT